MCLKVIDKNPFTPDSDNRFLATKLLSRFWITMPDVFAGPYQGQTYAEAFLDRLRKGSEHKSNVTSF